jgi:hypothetical protein
LEVLFVGTQDLCTGVPINSLTIGYKPFMYGTFSVKKGRGTFQNDGLIPIVTNYQNVRFAIFLLANLVHSIDRMKFLLSDILKVTSKVKILLGHQCKIFASSPIQRSILRNHPDGNRFIGPDFIGLDAKILRPYKQMIRHYNITLIQSNMDSDTSET